MRIRLFLYSLLFCCPLLTAGQALLLEQGFTATEVKAPFLYRWTGTDIPSIPPVGAADSWETADRINYGRISHGWAKFRVSSSIRRTVWMELTSHFIDSVEVWISTADQPLLPVQGPAHYRQQSSSLSPVSHRYYLYALTLPENRPATIWIRARVIPGDVLKFGVRLWTPSVFLNASQKDAWGWALFTGIVLAILGGVLVSLLLDPCSIYVYYAGYIIFMSIYMLLNDGWGVYLPGYLSAADKMSSISLALNLALCFFVLFCRSFLECKPLKYRPEILLLVINTWIVLTLEQMAGVADNVQTSRLFMAGGAGFASYGLLWVMYIVDARKRRFRMLPLLLLAVGVMVTFLLVSFFLVNSGLISNPLPDMLVMRWALLTELLILSTAWLWHRRQLKRRQAILAGHNRQLQLEIIEVQNTERDRIAQDLHDDLGGIIATLHSRIIAFEDFLPAGKAADLLKISSAAGERIRQISHNLMPPEFEKAGLLEAVKELTSESLKPEFRLSVFGKEERMVPERELHIYRVLAELIANIRRHAGADTVWVQFFFHPDMLTITLEDNGKKQPDPEGRGLGFRSINARLEYLGGRLLKDRSGSFSTVILNIPYR